jgi:Rad3-related DNA helicase
MMDKAIQALKSEHNVLLELPTGSGKSLSLLCAASAWIELAEKEMKQEQSSSENASNKQSSETSKPDFAPSGHGSEPTIPGENDMEPGAMDGDTEGGFIPGHAGSTTTEAKAKRPPRVYFASRTHSQIEQLVREMRKTAYRYEHVVLPAYTRRRSAYPGKQVSRTFLHAKKKDLFSFA